MITANPSSSLGSVVGTTQPWTGLKIQVATLTIPTRTSTAIKVHFKWESCEVLAVLMRTRVSDVTRKSRVIYNWTFVTTGLHTPYFHREHDLPSSAMFILEVHRRLSAAVAQRTVLNLEALHKNG